MYTASILSRNSMVSTVMHSVQMAKPTITISLRGEDECRYGDDLAKAKATSFTTLDKIVGNANFVAPADTRFDEVHIVFEGQTRVWMERYGAAPGGPMSSTQTVSGHQRNGEPIPRPGVTPFLTTLQFLKLHQPIDESAYPVPRIAEKGKTYSFPFTFVVPDRLLPTNCNKHHHKSPAVQEAHLRLPPSLGDGSTPVVGGCQYDDVTPDMARTSYVIKVRILRKRESDGQNILVAEESRKIRIIPTYEDLPPQIIDDNDKDHRLVKERTIKKGFFKGKLGKLTVSAQQPRPMQTGLYSHTSGAPPTTMVPIKVTFQPSDSASLPPALNSITTKLRVQTFYSTHPISYFPVPSNQLLDGTLGRYHEGVFLSTQCLAGVKWSPTEQESDEKLTHTTEITLPIVMPKCKALVPTFYSCLVARTYVIEVHLDVHTPGYNMGAHPGVTLKIPLQICSPLTAEQERVQEERRAQEEAEETLPGFGDEFFTPRSIAPPQGVPLLSEMGALRLASPVPVPIAAPVPVPVSAAAAEGSARNDQLPPHMRIRPNMPPPPGYSVFPGAPYGPPVRIPSPVGISPGCG